MTTVLIVAVMICAIGWMASHYASKALVIFMRKNEYTLPSDEDIRVCIREAIRGRKSSQ